MRVKSDRPSSKGGWLHKIEGAEPAEYVPAPPKKLDSEYHAIWEPYLAARVPNLDRIEQLAGLLGVAAFSLCALRVSYDESEKCWLFPERNHDGRIVGINRRWANGKRFYAVGSRPGLSFSKDWMHYPGPLFICEGASDVAALLTIGCGGIGKPNNVGGSEYLVKILNGFKREIAVIGERDWRSHEKLCKQIQEHHDPKCHGCAACFPGLHGCRVTADTLRKELRRKVEMFMPPVGFKDVREWVKSKTNKTSAMWIDSLVDANGSRVYD
jgi:hypothetical protein